MGLDIPNASKHEDPPLYVLEVLLLSYTSCIISIVNMYVKVRR